MRLIFSEEVAVLLATLASFAAFADFEILFEPAVVDSMHNTYSFYSANMHTFACAVDQTNPERLKNAIPGEAR
ncbi:MAG: hypothetical protein GY764_04540 [Halieaceae bacterium]|nr:hypothetical protein [Halieaceae bacterium]